MVEDDSSRQDGDFRPTVAALRRARREIRVAVGHGVESLQNWVEERWLPIRAILLGGCSWVISKAFEWLVSRSVEFGSWITSSLVRVATSTSSGQMILLLFFGTYVIHSIGQTKLIWGIRTNLANMTTGDGSEVRADGGDHEKISRFPGGAIGGVILGATIGSSFGIEGLFVGASVGWVLGDEYDKWFDEKVLGYPPKDEERRVEEQ